MNEQDDSHFGGYGGTRTEQVPAKTLIGFLRAEMLMRAKPGEDLSRIVTLLNELLWRLDPTARNADKALSFAKRYGPPEPARIPGRTYSICPCCNIKAFNASGCFICDYLVNEVEKTG